MRRATVTATAAAASGAVLFMIYNKTISTNARNDLRTYFCTYTTTHTYITGGYS